MALSLISMSESKGMARKIGPSMNMWWLSPHGLTLFFLVPLLWALYFIAPAILANNQFTSYFTWTATLAITFLLLAYAFGSWSGPQIFNRPLRMALISSGWYSFLFWLTIIAYFIWFLPLFRHFSLFLHILEGNAGAIYRARQLLETTPGITTFTQSGIAFTSILGVSLVEGRQPPRKVWIYAWIVCGLAAFRVLAMSERLALIEILLPFVPYFIVCMRRRRWRKSVTLIAPYFGIIALLLFFGATEYFRSWTNHYAAIRSSYSDFIVNRVAIYYVYAINSALGMVDELHSQWTFPIYSFSWLLNVPGLGYLGSGATDPASAFLVTFGVLQFNNISGVVAYVWDFGWLGAALLLLLNGLVAGVAWHGFRRKEGCLRYLYPTLYVGLLDLLREPYLGQGRSFVPLMLLICICVFSTIRGSRRFGLSAEKAVDSRIA